MCEFYQLHTRAFVVFAYMLVSDNLLRAIFGDGVILHFFVNILAHFVVRQILLIAEYLVDDLVVVSSGGNKGSSRFEDKQDDIWYFLHRVRIIIFLLINSFNYQRHCQHHYSKINRISMCCSYYKSNIQSVIYQYCAMCGICGQCNRKFSDECRNKIDCYIHNSSCFACRNCYGQASQSLQKCSKCIREFEAENMFYDFRCQAYLCQYQFDEIVTDHDKQQIRIKCGCWELEKHVLAFLANFCYRCSRKISSKNKSRQMCYLCLTGNDSRTHQERLQVKYKRQEELERYIKQEKYEECEKYERLERQKKQVYKKQLKQEKQEKQGKQIRYQKQERQPVEESIDSEELLLYTQILRLRNKLADSKERVNIARLTIEQIKNAIKPEECPLCLQIFSIDRKPLMVCLQQHLICQICFTTSKGIDTCPLCRDVIDKQKVGVCRQRLKILQIQRLIYQEKPISQNTKRKGSKQTDNSKKKEMVNNSKESYARKTMKFTAKKQSK